MLKMKAEIKFDFVIFYKTFGYFLMIGLGVVLIREVSTHSDHGGTKSNFILKALLKKHFTIG